MTQLSEVFNYSALGDTSRPDPERVLRQAAPEVVADASIAPQMTIITLPESLQGMFKADVPIEEMKTSISELSAVYEAEVKPLIPDTKLSLSDRLLFVAAATGNMNLLKASIEEGANVNCRTEGMETDVLDLVAQHAILRKFG